MSRKVYTRDVHFAVLVYEVSVVYSESLVSELDPLELVLPDSEELLLLRRDGPPDGAEPDFSDREMK